MSIGSRLTAEGERVHVRPVAAQDDVPFRRAVSLSARRIGEWNPVAPDSISQHLRQQDDDHRTFLILAKQPSGDHDIVGKVNVFNVVRGRMQGGVIGYDSYDPYAGTGLFADGLRLVLGICFAADGVGLHRIEANVRPGNAPSAGVLRSVGFRREGHVRDLLWLHGHDGMSWRDHDVYALLRDDWPNTAYPEHRPFRIVAVLGAESAPAAPALARELQIPLIRTSLVKSTAALATLVEESPIGAVVLDDSAAIDAHVLTGAFRVSSALGSSAADVTRLALQIRTYFAP